MHTTEQPPLHATPYVPLSEAAMRWPHLCPSEHSARWALRCHRKRLAEEGACIEVAGRILLHVQRFPETLERIGRERMLRRDEAGA